MKALVVKRDSSPAYPNFEWADLPAPLPGPRDVVVRVKAIAVNPVDFKMRKRLLAKNSLDPIILGWDAAGIVESVGNKVQFYRPGDEVFYAGSWLRPGCTSELHAVDERIVGRKPAALSFLEAAVLPLTALTAWESLFDRMGISPERAAHDEGKSLLVINGAGGVGSLALQLARSLTTLTVVATASRPESQDWCLSCGAHKVITHSEPLAPQCLSQGIKGFDFILCNAPLDNYWEQIIELLAPQGKICGIVDGDRLLDIRLLKEKSGTLCQELMFTRSSFETSDMEEQRRILNEVATLVEQHELRTTLRHDLGTVSPESMAKAHELLEDGKVIGKIGFLMP